MSNENENIEVTEDVAPSVKESIPTKEESSHKSKTKSKKRKKTSAKIEAVVENKVTPVVRSSQFKQTEIKTMPGRPRSNYKNIQEVPTKVDKSTNIANRNNKFDFS